MTGAPAARERKLPGTSGRGMGPERARRPALLRHAPASVDSGIPATDSAEGDSARAAARAQAAPHPAPECRSFSGCFYAGSPESDCVNISGTYTVAQDRRHVGRARPRGKGRRDPGPGRRVRLRRGPYAPAASDCGKAGCVRSKSGPRLQFAGRGPFAGLPPGAKVHGMISGPGARHGVPHALNGASRSAGGQHRTNGTGRQRPARRQAGNDRQARRRQCREASTR